MGNVKVTARTSGKDAGHPLFAVNTAITRTPAFAKMINEQPALADKLGAPTWAFWDTVFAAAYQELRVAGPHTFAGAGTNGVAKLQQLEAAEVVFRLAGTGKLTTDLKRKAIRMFVEDEFVVKPAVISISQALVAAKVLDALPKQAADTFLLALSFMDCPDEGRDVQFNGCTNTGSRHTLFHESTSKMEANCPPGIFDRAFVRAKKHENVADLGYWTSEVVDDTLQLGLGLGITTLASGKSLSFSSRAGNMKLTVTASSYDVPAFGRKSVYATCEIDNTDPASLSEISVMRMSAGDKAENGWAGQNREVPTIDVAVRGGKGHRAVVAFWDSVTKSDQKYETAAESGATMEAF